MKESVIIYYASDLAFAKDELREISNLAKQHSFSLNDEGEEENVVVLLSEIQFVLEDRLIVDESDIT